MMGTAEVDSEAAGTAGRLPPVHGQGLAVEETVETGVDASAGRAAAAPSVAVRAKDPVAAQERATGGAAASRCVAAATTRTAVPEQAAVVAEAEAAKLDGVHVRASAVAEAGSPLPARTSSSRGCTHASLGPAAGRPAVAPAGRVCYRRSMRHSAGSGMSSAQLWAAAVTIRSPVGTSRT